MDDPFALLIAVQTHRYGRDAEGVCVRLSDYGALDPEYSVQDGDVLRQGRKGDDPWNEWVGIPIRHRVSNIQSQRRMYKYLLMDEEA